MMSEKIMLVVAIVLFFLVLTVATNMIKKKYLLKRNNSYYRNNGNLDYWVNQSCDEDILLDLVDNDYGSYVFNEFCYRIVELIKKQREVLGFSVADLECRSGIKKEDLENIERYKKIPFDQQLFRLLHALNIELNLSTNKTLL